MNTGIYVRVSTEEQVQEGFSIRAQEEKLRDFARIKDWIVYKIYIDEGISGKNITERPAVNEMIADIKQGKISNVLVFKIDRLTRNTIDLINFVDLFNNHNCAFNSLMESIDTQTASGRMFLKIIGIFAEFERENISERSRLGFERKVREGYTLATRVPSYGYNKKVGERVQTVNEFEAGIVREVFDMFISNHMTCLDIAKALNKRKVPTKENAVWHARTIKNMLTNCNYMGNVRYATKDEKRSFETEGMHESIISKELYEATQALIAKISKKSHTKQPKEEHYFINILVCGNCGARMEGHSDYTKDGALRGAYRCSNYRQKKCNVCHVSHNKVENAFNEYIANIDDFTVTDEMKLKEEENQKEQNQKFRGSYQARYDKMEAKEQEVLGLYINGDIDFEAYAKIKKFIDKEKSYIESELRRLNGTFEEEEVTIKQEDIIRNLKENWNLLTNAERRQFLVLFVDKIHMMIDRPDSAKGQSVRIQKIEFCKN